MEDNFPWTGWGGGGGCGLGMIEGHYIFCIVYSSLASILGYSTLTLGLGMALV